MAKESNSSGDQNSSYLNQDDSDKSLVGKFKSIISTPLSKWFGRQENDGKPTIRRRGEEDEEEIIQSQPPAKRAKFVVNQGSDVNTLPIKASDNIIRGIPINRNYNNFPEPVAGPSGLQSRKLLNNVSTPVNSDINVHLCNNFLNGHKDSDSEESTSGYSSVPRIGSKEHVCQSEGSSKQPSPLQNNSPNRRSLFDTPTVNAASRSLFIDRTTSPQLHTSMSSRRPQFNSSTFGSPNFIDQTLSTEKVISSPFYNGTTIYGGASAYGNKFARRPKDFRSTLKKSVHIRPIKKNTESGSLVLGKTARKILETLEQYSTPVNDAKKIPVASKRMRLDTNLLGQHVGVNPYNKSMENASNKELQVPTVSDLLKMKQKAKLQSSTEAVRQIATASKSDLNIKHSQPSKETTADVIPEKIEKPKEPTRNDNQQALSSLPVTTLPKFEVVVPPVIKKTPEKLKETPIVTPPPKPPSIQPSVSTAGTTKKCIQKELPVISPQFTFSDPLIIAENMTSIVAINNFKFSEPLSNMNKTKNRPFKEKNNGQTNVKDVLASNLIDKFKPAAGTWECSTCLIRNQPEKIKCIACETPKTPAQVGLEKFKPASGTWECSTCLIRNQPEKTKCAACETPKLKPVQMESKTSTFGDKFKRPTNMWECPICMIRNSNDSAKCAACETANPKLSVSSVGFQKKFQPPTNTWECSTCLIRNNEGIDKCAACKTPRITKKPSNNELVNPFKMKADEWECSVCMIRNKETHTKCQCCEAAKPGSAKTNVEETDKKSTLKFNFGIDKAAAAQFKFGIQPTTTAQLVLPELPKPSDTVVTTSSSTSITFSFGVPPNLQKKPEATEAVKSIESNAVVSSSNVIVPATEKTATISALPKVAETTPATATISTNDNKDGKNTSITNSSSDIGGTSSPKPAFNFSVEKPKSTDKVEFNPPAFTAVSSNSVAPMANASFSFGKTSKPASSTTAPIFGQTKAPTVISGNNGLDSKLIPTFGLAKKSSTDTSLTSSTENQVFSFKKPESNGEPTNKAPMFNFGQSASQAVNAATTQSSGFNFGQVSKSPVFNFSAGKTDGSAGIFGGAASATSKNGPFNFGGGSDNTVTQKTSFNFGATSTTPASSGYSMGATPATTQAKPSSGFNFSTSFDINAKPSFNFSEGNVTAFSAQPSAEDGGVAAPATRKIKRGIRRTQR